MSLTPEQITEAGRMRAAGMGWDNIACKMGVGVFQLRGALQPGYLEYKRDINQAARDLLRRGFTTKRMRRLKPKKPDADPGHIASRDALPPHDVLADRDRRMMMAPRSLTAMLQGDPLPGRSALDKRQNT